METKTCHNAGDAERFVRRLAGAVVLVGFLLGWFVNEWFFLVDAFAGANLLQSSFTGFCPPERVYNWVMG
jgi:hypothetical protein